MSRQQVDDELFEIKNNFFIGNYQQCINEAQKMKKPSSLDVEIQRDIYLYRSYIAQNKYLVVLDDIKPNSSEELQHIKLLAEYFSNKNKKDAVIEQINQKISVNANSDSLIISAATIYLNENDLESAYRVLNVSDNLEFMAYIVDILLKLNRLDAAKKKLKEMQEKDDDATLTQLAQAWINIASGADKLMDAYYIFHELVEKYSATPLLLNGEAISFIGQGKYEEAEGVLQEALLKDPNYVDTLINFIVLLKHTGKTPEVGNRYLAQLKDSNSEHPYVKELRQKENEFIKICEQYCPSTPNIPV